MVLSPSQINEVKLLQSLCQRRAAPVVLIGAHAVLLHYPSPSRFTADVDFAIELDQEDFALLAVELIGQGWMQLQNREHRWLTPAGNTFDLLPAGPGLCASGGIVWPESGFKMSLLGFSHTFQSPRQMDLAPGLSIAVVSPDVLALLKIVAFVDDPQRRRKDLLDLREMLGRYEDSSNRMFSDEVFDAQLADFGLGCAFLLGRDLKNLCSAEEMDMVRAFIDRIDVSGMDHFAFVSGTVLLSEQAEGDANLILGALKKGIE